MGIEYTLKHLSIGQSSTQKYTSPKRPVHETNLPERQRSQHAQSLKSQLVKLKEELLTEQNNNDYSIITIQGKQDFDFYANDLEGKRAKIEVLKNGQTDVGNPIAVLRVDKEKGFNNFEKKIEKYATSNTKTGKPCHQKIIESIEQIRRTLLHELWNGKRAEWPADNNEQVWWEIWLIGGNNNRVEMNINRVRFIEECLKQDITVDISDFISFAHRQVTIIKASISQLEIIIDNSDAIVELDPPSSPIIQHAVQNGTMNLRDFDVRKINVVESDVRITILDTGVASAHPLLSPIIAENGMKTTDDDKTLVNDMEGHGTNVAGVAAYGNLERFLIEPIIPVPYKLESVRIPLDNDGSKRYLWGAITKQAVSEAESIDNNKKRIFNMSLGSPNQGESKPTSWSAAIDELTYNNGEGRLITIATGNVYPVTVDGYIDRNLATLIDDPAHSANGICVGGVTLLDTPISSASVSKVLAQKGEISPFTTSGMAKKAIKPEVLYEAGNVMVTTNDDIDICCSGVAILTTGKNVLMRPIELSHQTSMAAPGIARCLATIWYENPTYLPTTIRGLLVHSSMWTTAMCNQFEGRTKAELLRVCGYGVPNLEFACRSAKSSVCLIDEGRYEYFDEDGNIRKEMIIYDLPWPTEELMKLGEEKVIVRITLSYFIEPNPKVATSDYAGASLAWDFQGPYESNDEFMKRVNRANRTEEDPTSGYTNTLNWQIGSIARSRGTIQSDFTVITAAELASCGKVVIYPRKGWWDTLRENKNKSIPYSIIISIETTNTEINLYEKIEAVIEEDNVIENNIEVSIDA